MCGHGHEISNFHAFVLQRIPEWDISHLGTGGEIFRHMMGVSRRKDFANCQRFPTLSSPCSPIIYILRRIRTARNTQCQQFSFRSLMLSKVLI